MTLMELMISFLFSTGSTLPRKWLSRAAGSLSGISSTAMTAPDLSAVRPRR